MRASLDRNANALKEKLTDTTAPTALRLPHSFPFLHP